MKRKNYKVTVKVNYILTMDHSQTSMLNAKADVKKIVENYLKDGNDLRTFFVNQKPQTLFKVEIIDNGKD